MRRFLKDKLSKAASKLKDFLASHRQKKIKLFPKINLDSPKEIWQREHHEVFVQIASSYEWMLEELKANELIEKDCLIIKGSDLSQLAFGNLLASTLRRYYRLIHIAWDGDSELSLMIARSVFDHTVNALLIKQSSGNAELFLKYGAIENKKTLDRIATHFGVAAEDQHKHDAAQKLFDGISPLFKDTKGKVRRYWHPQEKLRDRADLVGLQIHYDLGFSRYSDIIHGGSSSLLDYAALTQDTWKFKVSPKDMHIHEGLTESAKYVLIVFACFLHSLRINKFSKAMLNGYDAMLKHQDYQDCLNKTPALKAWMQSLTVAN